MTMLLSTPQDELQEWKGQVDRLCQMVSGKESWVLDLGLATLLEGAGCVLFYQSINFHKNLHIYGVKCVKLYIWHNIIDLSCISTKKVILSCPCQLNVLPCIVKGYTKHYLPMRPHTHKHTIGWSSIPDPFLCPGTELLSVAYGGYLLILMDTADGTDGVGVGHVDDEVTYVYRRLKEMLLLQAWAFIFKEQRQIG